MTLTAMQNIPPRESAKRNKWSWGSIISPLNGVIGLAKHLSPLEALFYLEVALSGASEIAGQNMSIGWYAVVTLTLGASIGARVLTQSQGNKDEPRAYDSRINTKTELRRPDRDRDHRDGESEVRH